MMAEIKTLMFQQLENEYHGFSLLAFGRRR
jgi:hypothetical protein